MAMNDSFNLGAYRENQLETNGDVKYFYVELGINEDGAEDKVRIPQLRRWPIKAQDAFANGQIVEGIKRLVGDDDAALFEQYDWTFGEFEALFEALSKWSGFQTGQPSVKPPAPGLTLK